MTCIILDDEPLAVILLKRYVETQTDITLLADFTDAVAAQAFLAKNEVDLLFLDIEMPEMTGISFYKSLTNPPLVVFTTAYSNYAVEGFEMAAVDYLLKPIKKERFEKAVEKAKFMFLANQDPNNKTVEIPIFLWVKANYQSVKINIADIMYLESLNDYTIIYTKDKKMVKTLENFKQILEKLPKNVFTRIHRSYIVSTAYIKTLQVKQIILLDDSILPVGVTYTNSINNIMA
jgi:two-component system, LytTR family, response regulator